MSENKVQDDWGFSEADIPQSAWFKFDKVGDRIKGVVNEEPYIKKGSAGFEDQKVFALKQASGEVINVGIKATNDYVISRTNKATVGDILGFEFTKEIPPAVKGHHPAKSITPFVKYTPEGDAQRDLKSFNNA